MKDYSVEDVSRMLGTNPETVRRWIRAGKLKADSILSHGAQGISEEALNDFVTNTKEGKRRASAYNSGSSSAISGGVAVGTALLGFPLLSVAAGIIVDYAISFARKHGKPIDETKAVEKLTTHLQEEEERLTNELMMLEKERDKIQHSIDDLTNRLKQYHACLADSDAISGAVQKEICRRSELDRINEDNSK